MLRCSTGLEDLEDLRADFEQALGAAEFSAGGRADEVAIGAAART